MIVRPLMVVLMLLMHVPVGLDAMLASLHLQTAVEPTPPREATLFHVIPRDGGQTEALRHIAIHDDACVIAFVASWIRARLGHEVGV